MKKKLLYSFATFSFILSSLTSLAQNIQYDLRCSTDGTAYEIYVTRDETAGFLFAGSSVVTLILPTGSARTVSPNSESVSNYLSVSPLINAGGSGNDFYPFNSVGGSSLNGVLPANTPVLWLTLTPSDGTDQLARLFINGSDSNNISGVDASNVFTTLNPTAGIVDEYASNVSDTPINCFEPTLSTEAFELVPEFTIYPNPVADELYINTTANIESIQILNLTGVVAKSIKNYTSNTPIEVSDLPGAMYLIQINGGKLNKKFVKN